MHLVADLIALAQNADDAKQIIENWIEERGDREFFEFGGLDESASPCLLSEIRDELAGYKKEVFDKRLSEYKGKLRDYEKLRNAKEQGYYHHKIGDILGEFFCAEMPFFNTEDWNWSLPQEVPPEAEGKDYYAVKCDFRF